MADLTLLEQFKNGDISLDEVSKALRELYTTERKTITYKISVKGAISFYGMRRMPFTLYKQELDQISQTFKSQSFKQFILANQAHLSVKDPSKINDPQDHQDTHSVNKIVQSETSPNSSVTSILESFKNGQITMDAVQEQLRELENKTVTYKVSDKGAISFYGIRRMPITLYREELDQIMNIVNSHEFIDYLKIHSSELSIKTPKEDKNETTKSVSKPKQSIKLNMVNN